MAAQHVTATSLLASFSPRRTSCSLTHENRGAASAGSPLSLGKWTDRVASTRASESDVSSTPSPMFDRDLLVSSPTTPFTDIETTSAEHLPALSCAIDRENISANEKEDDTSVLRRPSERVLRQRSLPTTRRTRVVKRSSTSSRRTPSAITTRRTHQEISRIQDHAGVEVTAFRRKSFLLSHKERFLPLLPSENYISKLQQDLEVAHDTDESVPFKIVDSQPAGVRALLKDHQLRGLSFLLWLHRNQASGILGDEMGLGKTLQTLSLFQYLEEEQVVKRRGERLQPHLVVCPLTVVDSWINEAHKWTPDLRVLRFHGPPQERARLKKAATGTERRSTMLPAPRHSQQTSYHLIVTSYEVFAAENAWFKRAFPWKYVVLDEGHRIKNESTKLSSALQTLRAEHRLILTGTPLQNNLLEMWSLLHWLYPDVFTDTTSQVFRTSFDLSRGIVSTNVLENTRSLLELICLRRLKDSPTVSLGLPPKTEICLYVPLTLFQRFWYTRILTRSDDVLATVTHDRDGEEGVTPSHISDSRNVDYSTLSPASYGEVPTIASLSAANKSLQSFSRQDDHKLPSKSVWQRLMNLIMQLRKVCLHPYLIPDAVPEPYVPGEHVICASAKYIVLRKLIHELVLRQGKKMLIFSGFTQNLDIIDDMLHLLLRHGSQVKHTRLDGSTPRARRNLAIRIFNSSLDCKIMLVSTRAGGTGINLAAATEVVFMDDDWNPQVTLQAEARAHRIGQTKPVTIYKICTQGTVEEQMLGRIRKKLYLSAKISDAMSCITDRDHIIPNGEHNSAPARSELPQLDNAALKLLIQRGSRTLTHSIADEGEMLSWDFDTMVQKCRDNSLDSNSAPDLDLGDDASDGLSEEQWLAIMEKVDCATFEGKKLARPRPARFDTLADDISRSDRRKDKNVTVMIDGFAVNKQSLLCGPGEAVPTLTGRGEQRPEPQKTKKDAITNQRHCQVCHAAGNLINCDYCPRAYHETCISALLTAGQNGSGFLFACPQHRCCSCRKTTSDAGGMLYRCRWCFRAHCEDCLGSHGIDLLGDSLPEYDTLGYPPHQNAFYIGCPSCIDRQHNDEDFASMVCHLVNTTNAKQNMATKQLAHIDPAGCEKKV